jgi:hypothetical protein
MLDLYNPKSKSKNRQKKRENCIGFNKKQSKLSIYRPILEKYFGDKKYLYIYYDSDEKKIALKPVEDQDEFALKLIGDNTKSVQIGRFLKYYKIEISESMQIPIKDKDDMIMFKVS